MVRANQFKEQLEGTNEQLMVRHVELQSLMITEISAASNRMEKKLLEMEEVAAAHGAESSAAATHHSEELAASRAEIKEMLAAQTKMQTKMLEMQEANLQELQATRTVRRTLEGTEPAGGEYGAREATSQGPWVIKDSDLEYDAHPEGNDILGRVQPQTLKPESDPDL